MVGVVFLIFIRMGLCRNGMIEQVEYSAKTEQLGKSLSNGMDGVK
jgi:hypothetical protein